MGCIIELLSVGVMTDLAGIWMKTFFNIFPDCMYMGEQMVP